MPHSILTNLKKYLVGPHNGTVDDTFYFDAPPHKGIFVRRSQLEPYCPPDE
jgi:hypothetical protein